MKDLNNTQRILLPAFAAMALFSAYLFPAFPWMVCVAFAPFFALYQHFKQKEAPFYHFGLFVVIPLAVVHAMLSFIKPEPWASLPLSMNFGILISFSFFAYWLTDHYAKNKLGFLTVVIYFAALEYGALLLKNEYAYQLLGSTLSGFPALQRWNTYTGIIGVSCWIMIANILVYHIFFRDLAIFRGQFRWLSFLYSILLLSIPVAVSFWAFGSEAPVLSPEVVASNFENVLKTSNFAAAGEVMGRTCAWVAVLLILYGLVKRKVKK